MRPFTEEERAKYFSGLRDFYQHFITLVAKNRELPTDSIDNLGQGKVWTGSEAMSNGLVDGLGGLKEALDLLKTRLGDRTDYSIELYPRNRPWLQLPMPSLFSSISQKIFGKSNSAATETLLSAENGLMFTRMPYDLSIE
jgi:protease-4